MTRSEPPHTVSSHPLLSLDIVIEGKGSLVAGESVEGVLQLNVLSGSVALGEISIELVVEAEAKTSFDRVYEVLHDECVVFQGPELPPSNAVLPDEVEGYPGFRRARRGVTAFPISVPVPSQLTSSYSSPFANITYTLHATCHFASEHKGVLHTSRVLEVVQSPGVFSQDLVAVRFTENRLRLSRADGAGSLALSLRHDRGWVASNDGKMWVQIEVINTTSLWTLPPILRLVKRTTIHFPHEPFEVEEIVVQEQYDDRYIVAPNSEQDLSLSIALAADLRATESPVFSVRYFVCVLVHLAGQMGAGQSIEANLPIEILHPSSVPWRRRQGSAAPESEIRRTPPIQPQSGARKRWSMPAGASIASLLAPLVPVLPHPQLAHAPPSVSPEQYAQFYPQPAFVVHQLSPITEEHESRAQRTSRHLRETSGNRGRSVSPPIPPPRDPCPETASEVEMPMETRRYDSPPRAKSGLGFGPRPMPRRSSTSAIPTARSMVAAHEASSDQIHVRGIGPASQDPLQITVQAEALDPVTKRPAALKEVDHTTPTQTLIISPSSSPVRSRKSVFDLFVRDIAPVPASFGKLAMVGPTGSARGGRGGQVTSFQGFEPWSREDCRAAESCEEDELASRGRIKY